MAGRGDVETTPPLGRLRLKLALKVLCVAATFAVGLCGMAEQRRADAPVDVYYTYTIKVDVYYTYTVSMVAL